MYKQRGQETKPKYLKWLECGLNNLKAIKDLLEKEINMYKEEDWWFTVGDDQGLGFLEEDWLF